MKKRDKKTEYVFLKRWGGQALLFVVILLMLPLKAFGEDAAQEFFSKEMNGSYDINVWLADREEQLKRNRERYSDFPFTAEELEAFARSMQLDPQRPMVALTFDDGPVPGLTDIILDTLEENHARATFFICGWRLKREGSEDLLRRMAASGCEIGNHTYNHTYLKELDRDSAWKIIHRNNKVIEKVLPDYKVYSLRPPGGQTSLAVRSAARRNDMAVILWSQSGNVHAVDAEDVYENVFRQEIDGRELTDGDIILLHDTQENVVNAAKMLVPELIRQGYQLVTVQELLACRAGGMQPGVQYYSGMEYKYE